MIASSGVASEQIEKCCIRAIFFHFPQENAHCFVGTTYSDLFTETFRGGSKVITKKKKKFRIRNNSNGVKLFNFRARLNKIAIAVGSFSLSLRATPLCCVCFGDLSTDSYRWRGWMCTRGGSWNTCIISAQLGKSPAERLCSCFHTLHVNLSFSVCSTPLSFKVLAHGWLLSIIIWEAYTLHYLLSPVSGVIQPS